MRILIVGGGKVGHTLAAELLREGHDITLIDQNDDVIRKAEDNLDVMCVHGNGANASTLMDAEVERADILIAAKEIEKIREELYTIIAEHSGQPIEKIFADGERDYWMNSQEAKEYGMIDEILTRKAK